MDRKEPNLKYIINTFTIRAIKNEKIKFNSPEEQTEFEKKLEQTFIKYSKLIVDKAQKNDTIRQNGNVFAKREDKKNLKKEKKETKHSLKVIKKQLAEINGILKPMLESIGVDITSLQSGYKQTLREEKEAQKKESEFCPKVKIDHEKAIRGTQEAKREVERSTKDVEPLKE